MVHSGLLWGTNQNSVPNSLETSSRSEQIFQAALAALDFDRPSVKMCQALLLMAMFCIFLSNGRLSQGWLLGGMAIRMVPALQLDVDPDTLEETSNQRFTWVQKEVRRRLFVMIVGIDIFDVAYRERCSGLWRQLSNVKLPEPFELWSNVDVLTGNLTVVDTPERELGLPYILFSLIKLVARTVDYTLSKGNPFTGGASLKDILSRGSPESLSTEWMQDVEFVVIDQDIRAFMSSLPARIRSLDQIEQFSLGRLDHSNMDVPSYLLVKLHLYVHSTTLKLHRKRMIQAIAVMTQYQRVMSLGGNPFSVQGSDLSFLLACMESIRTCSNAASKLVHIIGKDVDLISPVPLNPPGKRPAALLFGVGECKAIMEAAIHYLIVAATLRASSIIGVNAGIFHIPTENPQLVKAFGCDLRRLDSRFRLWRECCRMLLKGGRL
ncbi:hypothetical protein BC829DRAFT_207752 [Chytridium lagenaria]|nr:hypothetical protein BC829DRAFT_207752 [Chytridium lagenaria]